MPLNPSTPTLSNITKGLEVAVAAVDGKRKAAEDAAKVAADAQVAYQGALDLVKTLHAQYSDFMRDILTNFGQIHR